MVWADLMLGSLRQMGHVYNFPALPATSGLAREGRGRLGPRGGASPGSGLLGGTGLLPVLCQSSRWWTLFWVRASQRWQPGPFGPSLFPWRSQMAQVGSLWAGQWQVGHIRPESPVQSRCWERCQISVSDSESSLWVRKEHPFLISCRLWPQPGPWLSRDKWCCGPGWAVGEGSQGGHSPRACEQRGRWARERKCPSSSSSDQEAVHRGRRLASLTCMGAGRGCWILGSYLAAVLGLGRNRSQSLGWDSWTTFADWGEEEAIWEVRCVAGSHLSSLCSPGSYWFGDFYLNSQDLVLGLEMCKEVGGSVERRGWSSPKETSLAAFPKLPLPEVGTVHGQLWHWPWEGCPSLHLL